MLGVLLACVLWMLALVCWFGWSGFLDFAFLCWCNVGCVCGCLTSVFGVGLLSVGFVFSFLGS